MLVAPKSSRPCGVGSVAAVIAAEREELRRVEGIGASTADAIRWAVREEVAVYGGAEEVAVQHQAGGSRKFRHDCTSRTRASKSSLGIVSVAQNR